MKPRDRQEADARGLCPSVPTDTANTSDSHIPSPIHTLTSNNGYSRVGFIYLFEKRDTAVGEGEGGCESIPTLPQEGSGCSLRFVKFLTFVSPAYIVKVPLLQGYQDMDNIT